MAEEIKINFFEMLIDRITNLELKLDSIDKILKNNTQQTFCLKCTDSIEFHSNGSIKNYKPFHMVHRDDYNCDICNKLLIVKNDVKIIE